MSNKTNRVLAFLLVVGVASAACAHTEAGKRRQKIAVATAVAGLVVVVGLAILAGSATTCEDTGNCSTPQGRLVPEPPTSFGLGLGLGVRLGVNEAEHGQPRNRAP